MAGKINRGMWMGKANTDVFSPRCQPGQRGAAIKYIQRVVGSEVGAGNYPNDQHFCSF
jgi:hypothetical protein